VMESKIFDKVFVVKDVFTGETKKVRIKVGLDGVVIVPEGYGDYCSADGEGAPVMIEFAEGNPRVVVWDNINNEDASHIIDLSEAAEKNREEV
jgi:hypothetical protein